MAEQLFLRLGDTPDQASFVVLDAEGRLVRGPEAAPLGTIAALASERPVTALLPATELVTTQAELPAASPARLRQMLPYSLEDDFAADIDELQFAAGERDGSERLPVSVIGRDRLEFWLGALRAAGITARRVCSEADAVPDTPGTVNLFLDGPKMLGRRPTAAPFCFEELTLAEVWQLLANEQDDASDLDDVVLFADSATLGARAAEIDAWRGGVANLNVRELPEGVLPRLAMSLAQRPGTNLLQGDFAPRSNVGALLRPWRFAAGFLLAFLAFTVVGKAAELWKLSQDDSRLTAQATELCTTRFSSAQLTRCRAEMQRRLADNNQAGAAGGTGFLSTLAAVAAAGGDGLTIAGINYRSRVLTLETVVPSIAFLDTFNQRLAESGPFRVEVQSTSPQGSRVDARLQIVAVQP